MATGKTWVFSPGSGGTPIPEAVKRRTTVRLNGYAVEHFAGRYTRLDIRFRGQFCYIDAYTNPGPLGPDWPPPGWHETREEYVERMSNTPTHLCRLRYFGDEEAWGFAFYGYSHERYETSVFDNGTFFGTPEDAFEITAGLYLQ